MIGFLFPVFLLAVLAAAIPVILHLMRRREVRRLTFPAIRYLRQAEQRHAQRLRLRHLLLLAARMLIVALAATAAAGPLIGRGGAADHRPTALAIVLDESQSSAQLAGELRLIDVYVERTLQTLELVTAADRVAIFGAVRPVAGAVTDDVAGARSYMSGARPTAGLARIPAAVQQATAWLRSAEDLAREMHILTDLQRVSLGESAVTDSADAGEGVSVVVFAPDYAPQPNGAIGDVAAEVEPLSMGLPTRVSAPLSWFGDSQPNDPIVVRLVRGDDVVDVTEGRFDGSALMRLPPQDSGWIQGYVEIELHGLAADDRRYFTWYSRPEVRVATVGSPTAFLDHALETLARGRRLSRTDRAAAEVWLASDGEAIEEGLAAGASVVVVPPANPLDLPRLNSRLARARVPWRYDTSDRGGTTRLASAPVEGLAGQAVREFYPLTAIGLVSADSAVLQLESGEPWLVRGTTTQGTVYLLLASPLTLEASDIPLSAAMVPLVDALVGDWARRSSVESPNYEGTTAVRVPPRAREVLTPDGARASVEGGAWLNADAPGNYAVTDGRDTLLGFSVNAPLAEAELRRGSRSELEAALPQADWSWVDSAQPAAWESAIFGARRGRLAWRPLVVALLLVSIVEAALSAAGRRRSTQLSGVPESR